MSNHEDLPYVKHILDSINDIEESTKNLSKEEFKKNKDVKDATVRRIEIIGEAVKNISKKIKNKYPNIKWKEMAGTRDILIHHYFGVDLNAVWDILKKDLPDLKKEILKIKEELNTKS